MSIFTGGALLARVKHEPPLPSYFHRVILIFARALRQDTVHVMRWLGFICPRKFKNLQRICRWFDNAAVIHVAFVSVNCDKITTRRSYETRLPVLETPTVLYASFFNSPRRNYDMIPGFDPVFFTPADSMTIYLKLELERDMILPFARSLPTKLCLGSTVRQLQLRSCRL